MLNLSTINECIKIVNINTKTNNNHIQYTIIYNVKTYYY